MLPAQQKNSKISSQQVVAKAKEDLKKQLQIKQTIRQFVKINRLICRFGQMV